jgi:hypothetical protein
MIQPPQNTNSLQIMNLFDFSKGMVQRRTNLLDYPVNALWDGENVNVSDKFLQTRPGTVVCSTEILADGVVEYLTQSRFPVINKTYLLAQLRSAAACKLYVSDTALPSTSITFTEVYDLGLTSGMVSVATLNNRAIITEGVANPPLVFLGGLATDGSDFATPLTVFGTLDGTYFFDMTGALTDADPDTEYTLNAMPTAGGIYVRFDVRTLSGLYFEVETANTTICDLLFFRWDGTQWVNIDPVDDNTKVANCTLAQNGTVTWAEANTEYMEIAEVAGYWLKITFSITSGSTEAQTEDILTDTNLGRQDLRGTIVSWAYDAPFVGRFKATGGGIVTPAATLLMARAYFADSTSSLITHINGDYVWLEYNKPTQAVSGIYYSYVTAGGLATLNSFTGGDYKGWYAFDRDNNSKFWRGFGDTAWLKVDLGTSLTFAGVAPTGRRYHSAVVYDDSMCVFGGDSGGVLNQETHQLDLETLTWSGALTTTGVKPSARVYHATAINGNNMYVFGGHNGSIKLQDTHYLDLDTLTWSGALTTSGTKPTARDFHSAVIYGDYLYIFGGDDVAAGYLQDTHRLDLGTLAWSGALTTSGTKPAARYVHSAVVHDNYMYVFGGLSSSYYQDTHRLNLDTLEWSGELTTTGTKPTGRFGHTARVYGDYMYVFGGQDTVTGKLQDTHKLNLDTLEWSGELTTTGTKPVGRQALTMGINGDFLYVFGGYGATTGYLSDTHRLNLVDLTWGKYVITQCNIKAPDTTGYGFPKDFTIQASNDDSSWTTLDTQTSMTDPGQDTEITPITIANTSGYRYYKIDVTDRTSVGDISIGELRLMEYADIDVVPILTSDTAPSPIVVTSSGYPQYGTQNGVTTIATAYKITLPTLATVTTMTVTQTTPGSSLIYHALSFDAQVTFKVFKAAAWRSIAKLDATYQYNDSATATPAWHDSTVQTMQGALSQAWATTQNKMTKTELEAMTSANFAAAGGPAASSTIDFAFYLVPDGVNLPSVDKYVVNSEITAGVVNTEISKVTFKAPTQLLRNISESGVYDTAMAFVIWIAATNKLNDYSVEVADGGLTTYAVLNSLVTADYIYVAGVSEFNGLKLTLANGANQVNSVTLSAAYWNGSTWAAVTITDGTAVSGKTLNQSGTITWTTPTDWKDLTPIVGAMVQGFWIRLKPSGTLSATVNIAEARLSAQPPPLVKHKFTSTLDNRLVLGNRPEAKDQVDLSRQYEEYGFTGDMTFSARAGTQEGIVAVTKTYNQVWLAKGDDWFALSTNSDGTIGTSRADATSQIPINNTSCVIAPLDQLGKTTISPIADAKNRTGIYYINYSGAWCFTGTEIYKISESVNWWLLVSENPRIDLDYLQGCVGAHWPERGWIMWAVPMIVGAATSQATNNYLIVYDLGLGAWMPIFSVSASALSQAIEYKSSHPEKMGALALYAGGYDGIVRRIFEVTSTNDAGTAIACDAETGWLPFNDPAIEKILRVMKIFGTLTTGNLTLGVRCDGEGTTQAENTFTITDLSLSPTKAFVIEFNNRNVHGNMFKFLLSWSGPGSIYGMQIEYGNMRDWPTTA